MSVNNTELDGGALGEDEVTEPYKPQWHILPCPVERIASAAPQRFLDTYKKRLARALNERIEFSIDIVLGDGRIAYRVVSGEIKHYTVEYRPALNGVSDETICTCDYWLRRRDQEDMCKHVALCLRAYQDYKVTRARLETAIAKVLQVAQREFEAYLAATNELGDLAEQGRYFLNKKYYSPVDYERAAVIVQEEKEQTKANRKAKTKTS